MQKNRLKWRFFCVRWSECGDSNPGPPAPKAGALPTAQHPDMKLSNCPGVFSQSKRATNCATPGYVIFQLWSNMGSAPVFDQSSARGKTPSALAPQRFPGFLKSAARTPASRSQSRRATNCATPGHMNFCMIARSRGKSKLFLSPRDLSAVFIIIIYFSMFCKFFSPFHLRDEARRVGSPHFLIL